VSPPRRANAVFGLAPALRDLRSRHHSMESPRRGYGPPDLLRSGLLTRVRESADCLVAHPVGSDVIGVPIAAVGPIGDEHVRALTAEHREQLPHLLLPVILRVPGEGMGVSDSRGIGHPGIPPTAQPTQELRPLMNPQVLEGPLQFPNTE